MWVGTGELDGELRQACDVCFDAGTRERVNARRRGEPDASFVGFLTLILAAWASLAEKRRWVRNLALAALGTVIAQGLLGGLTVLLLLPTAISMAHACLAQTFFCLIISITLFTSPQWKHGLPRVSHTADSRTMRLPILCAMTSAAIYIQLLLGALMRHTDSGLAIKDFPLAFGRIIPPFTSSHVAIHFSHRVGAVLVASMIVWTFYRIRHDYRDYSLLSRPASLLFSLLWVQLLLGASTVWSQKGVIITTTHVVTGALVLGTSVLLTLRAYGMIPKRVAAWQ